MSITIIIIAVTVLTSLLAFNNHKLMNDLILWPYLMKQSPVQSYRLVTSGFIHADYQHLAFNMITLYFFADAIEYYFEIYQIPISQLLTLYFGAIVVANLPSTFKHSSHSYYRSLGASGGVSALIFAAVYLDPWNTIYLFYVLPVPSILFALAYIAYCIYADKKGSDNINHNAHLWGAIFGFLFMLLFVDPSRGVYFIEKLLNF
jgi:membrane associated rhomboid family serine protease